MPGTMFDVLERLEEKVDRNEKTGQKTQRAAKKAARHGRFTKIVVLILLILLLLFGIWFVHATQRAVGRVTGPLDKLHDLVKPFLFGISGDIPPATYGAYQNAAAAAPGACHLSWTLLAGIGKIEASHGLYSGDGVTRTVSDTGEVSPAIRGVVLDGTTSNTMVVYDTDGGALDGDPGYDRAVGPAQALPSTWAAYMPAGSDPQNVNDSSKFMATVLCSHGDLNDPTTLDTAIRSYNNSAAYVADVEQWKAAYDQVAGQQPPAPTPAADAKAPSVWQVMRDEAWSWWAHVNWGPLKVLNPVAEYWLRPSSAAKKENSSQPTHAPPKQGATAQGQRIADVAMKRVGTEFNAGVAAQCAYFVRDVLDEAGVPVGVTKQALDGSINPGPVGDGEARSFGADMGEVVYDPSLLEPGDVAEFTDTYGTVLSGGGWPAGSITHVGIVVGIDPQQGPMIVDRSTASAPVKYRPLSTFEHFAGAVRLPEKTRSI